MSSVINDCFPDVYIAAEPPPPKGGYCKCYRPGCEKAHSGAENPKEGANTTMRWKKSPTALAKELRRVADWLDKHGARGVFIDEE